MIQRHQRLRLAGVLFLALLVTPSAMADVWYVNKAAASGGDGFRKRAPRNVFYARSYWITSLLNAGPL